MPERYEIQGEMFWVIDPELGIEHHERLGVCEKSDGHICYRKSKDLHGPSVFYGPRSEVLSLTWYVEGKKVGKVRRYYLNGQLYALERYVEGVCHGEQEYYYLNGTLKTKIPYNRGCLEGEVLLYWPSGKLKRRGLYSQGEKQEEVFFDELQTTLS